MTRRPPRALVFAGLLVLVLALACASLLAGRVWVPPGRLFAAPGDPLGAILIQLRLPRTILCLAVGGSLGLCGAALQGYTRNPLADPALLGVSQEAYGVDAEWLRGRYGPVLDVAGRHALGGPRTATNSSSTAWPDSNLCE